MRTELEAIVKAQAKDSSVVAGLVAFDELVKLPYLNACINEGYRIDPITGIALSRTVPSGGARLNGFDIPEGVSFVSSIPTLAAIAQGYRVSAS